MTFQNVQTKRAILDINFSGQQINTAKFLGLNIDDNMSWSTQIDHMCSKLNSLSYVMYRLSKIVNRAAVLTAYHGQVSAILRYGLMFWGNATNIDRVFKAQKRCIRSIHNLKCTESCKPHFIRSKILTLPSLYIYEVSVFVKYNTNYFCKFKSERYGNKISSVARRTALFSKNIVGMAPKIYNKLPEEIRKCNDVRHFKCILKTFLLQRAYYSVNDYLNGL